MGREEEIAYAREHGIPVKGGTEAPPYSIDDNIWGRSSEGGPIEDLGEPPRDDVFELVGRSARRPRRAAGLVVEFDEGRPVALDGERLGLVELLERLPAIGCRHGVGIVDHIEDRIVGLKVRDLYEVPAAEMILTAHTRAGEAGRHDPPEPLQAQLDSSGRSSSTPGSGTSRCARPGRLHGVGERAGHGQDHAAALQGQRKAVARRSPNALYDEELASFGESGGLFSQQASPGFIELWTLQSRMAYGIRQPGRRRSNGNKGLHGARAGRSGRSASRVARKKMARNRAKLGAAGVIALVLLGGVIAAKQAPDA